MALLTQNQFDVLREMHLSEDKCEGDYPWFRPMDIGGSDASHHSRTLRLLAKKGYVRTKRRSLGSRGSYLYSLTTEGWIALQKQCK